MTKLIVHQFLDKASEMAKQSLEITEKIISPRLNQMFLDACLDAHRKAYEQYQQELRKLLLECYDKMNDEDALYIAEAEHKPIKRQDGHELEMTIGVEMTSIIVPKGADMEYVYAMTPRETCRLYGPFTKDFIDEHMSEIGNLEAL